MNLDCKMDLEYEDVQEKLLFMEYELSLEPDKDKRRRSMLYVVGAAYLLINIFVYILLF